MKTGQKSAARIVSPPEIACTFARLFYTLCAYVHIHIQLSRFCGASNFFFIHILYTTVNIILYQYMIEHKTITLDGGSLGSRVDEERS